MSQKLKINPKDFLNLIFKIKRSNNYKIKVQAKNEEVLKIEANDKKKLLALAWHIGNRHVPAEIHKDFILVQKDEVIAKMLKLLGAKICKKKLPFTPESGAYRKH